jgi:hypothetical protein
LLLLTVVTGLVDAVSILQLGRVFVANMTGNVVFTGFAIAGAPGFSLSASLFALFGFLVGAMIGGSLIGRLGPIGRCCSAAAPGSSLSSTSPPASSQPWVAHRSPTPSAMSPPHCWRSGWVFRMPSPAGSPYRT